MICIKVHKITIFNLFYSLNERDIRYIYFNRMNLAQKSTLNITGSVPKLILNFIADLADDIKKLFFIF